MKSFWENLFGANECSKRGHRSHFTLIELLVVIAIIAILAAILLPSLARAKDKAKEIACVNNMKQLTSCINMYFNDFDDYYPISCYDKSYPTTDPEKAFMKRTPYIAPAQGFNNWMWLLYPYHKAPDVYSCPNDYFGLKEWKGWTYSMTHFGTTIVNQDGTLTGNSGGGPLEPPARYGRLKYSKNKILIAEGWNSKNASYGYVYSRPGMNHGNKRFANVLMRDLSYMRLPYALAAFSDPGQSWYCTSKKSIDCGI